MSTNTEVSAISFQTQLEQLDALGFSCKRKNLKLLSATNGDFETVKNFLAARDALKTKTKQLKSDAKIARRLEKKGLKKERRVKTGERKERKDRKDRKERKEKIAKVRDSDSDSNSNGNVDRTRSLLNLGKDGWPSGVVNLYLDGNNMLYVVSSIRALVLKRKNRAAEAALEQLARSFSSALNLKHCTLIFDDTKRLVTEEAFSVCSARPAFSTSDDALVEMAKANTEPAVFVTSDRELLNRLEASGKHVLLCKPKEWFLFVARTLGGASSGVDALDDWVANWMKENSCEEIVQEMQTKLNL
jgi:hypothetical protein